MADEISANHVPGEVWTLGAGQGCAPGYANQQAAGVNRWTCIPMKTFQQIQALDFSGLAEVEGLADHYYQLAGGKPTASSNVAYGGTGTFSVGVNEDAHRLVFDDGAGSDDPVRPIQPPSRGRDIGDDFGGSIPRRVSRAVPTIFTDDDGGDDDDGGGSGGGGGGSGSGSGSGTGSGGSSGSGSGSGATDSANDPINRLIDLVAAQYAGAGGGGGVGGGVVALPTEIASESAGTSSGSSVGRVLLVIGVVIAAIWYYRKHKKQSAAA